MSQSLAYPPPKVVLRSQQPATKKPYTSPLISVVAGGTAGGIEAAATYPFEFAKTRLQLRNGGGTNNPIAMIRQIVAQEGVGSLYTGCSTLIVGTIMKASVRFLSFDSIRNILSDDAGRLSAGRGILAGLLAGCVESVVAVTPTERIKTALIDDAKGAKRFNNPFHVAKLLVQERGISNLYRGLLSTTIKQSTTSAVRMGSYNVLKMASISATIPQGTIATFGMGAAAGIITVYATQPFDTIKTRSQSAAGTSTRGAFVSILRDSGVRGFWKGSTMRLGRLVFSGGIVFSVYEHLASLLTKVSQRRVGTLLQEQKL